MRKFLYITAVIICGVITAAAQTTNRKQYVSDKTASLKVEKVETAEAADAFPGTAYSYPLDDYKPGVVRVGPSTTYLKEGLRTDEVIRLLGKPASISEHKDHDVTVTTYEFQRGEHKFLIAEFVNGLLVRSHMEMRDAEVVQE
jgi:hypothetical protein